MLRISEGLTGAVVEGRAKEFVVSLVETVYAHLEIVLCQICSEAYLAAAVARTAILGGGNRKVVG